MTDTVARFCVGIRARAKQRPRVTKTGHAYTPDTTLAYERQIRSAASVAMAGRPPTERAVAVGLCIKFARPKRPPKSRITQAPTRHADVDNLAKSILDACNGVIFADDAQVVALVVTKTFSDVDLIEILVTEMDFAGK